MSSNDRTGYPSVYEYHRRLIAVLTAERDALRRSMERLLLCDDVAEGVKVYLRDALQEAKHG